MNSVCITSVTDRQLLFFSSINVPGTEWKQISVNCELLGSVCYYLIHQSPCQQRGIEYGD